jgi:transposase
MSPSITSGRSPSKAARLAGQLLDLDREIKDLDKQLGARFAQHPHAEIITSIDGFGPVLGAELLADTGGDLFAAFGTPARLAAYAGLAPVPRDSGRVRGNLHRPKRCHRGLRRVFYLAALSAIKRTDGTTWTAAVRVVAPDVARNEVYHGGQRLPEGCAR